MRSNGEGGRQRERGRERQREGEREGEREGALSSPVVLLVRSFCVLVAGETMAAEKKASTSSSAADDEKMKDKKKPNQKAADDENTGEDAEEKPIAVLDEDDIALLKSYGLGPYVVIHEEGRCNQHGIWCMQTRMAHRVWGKQNERLVEEKG